MPSRLALLVALATLAARAHAQAPPPARDAAPAPAPSPCVKCHERLQPGIVSDWSLSRHARAGIDCQACHGLSHTSEGDVALARLPTIEECQRCHERRALQFRRGKHARAWAAVKAMPSFHYVGRATPDDVSGCATCHRIGLKTEGEAEALRRAGASHGQASCDACHTRHVFSTLEARQPEACRTCHGSLQYDAWASSKHGTRHLLKVAGTLPATVAAPTCQTCHMQDGDHANRTPWGNLGLRLPLPVDEAWAADRRTLFQALGILDAEGREGPRYVQAYSTGITHLDRLDYQGERAKIVQACRQCHALPFIREQLDRRDRIMRQSDGLCAAAVRDVAALYAEGLLAAAGPGPFPDLVAAPRGRVIEQRLATMFFEHRARLLATAFHMSSDWTTWMSALEGDFFAIGQMADGLRAEAKKPARRAKRPAATK